VAAASLSAAVPEHPSSAPRVCLGPGAPEELAGWLRSAGLEPLGYTQKNLASLYVDFVGARPPGIDVLSIGIGAKHSRNPHVSFDLLADDWQSAAGLIASRALGIEPPILTTDAGMQSAISRAIAVASSGVNVVISGEIGTGKHGLARLIHSASRWGTPLYTVNCASFEQLDLSQVLNQQSPVPTNAPAAASGPGAALYLDEVGELSEAAQVRLLQLVQALERTPSSDAKLGYPSLRFLAATNRSLAMMVDRGYFRRDLYWRLNVFSLQVPALRERPADIALLARFYLQRINPKRRLTPAALKVLANYAFPGNGLELENLIKRLGIVPLDANSGVIDVGDVRRNLMMAPQTSEVAVSGWKASREAARREMILRTIAAAGGDRLEAARRLGIAPRTLQYHITKAGLSRRNDSRSSARTAAVAFAGGEPPPQPTQSAPGWNTALNPKEPSARE